MIDPALELLNEFQRDIPILHFRVLVEKYESRLIEIEPFQTIQNSWVWLPMGVGSIGSSLPFNAVYGLLRSGRRPEAILETARREVADNAYPVQEVRSVRGISLNRRIDLEKGVYLLPNSELRRTSEHGVAFGNSMLGRSFPTDIAALVMEAQVSPAIEASYDGRAKPDQGQAERQEYARLFKLALALTMRVPVTMQHTYAIASDDSLFGQTGSALNSTTDYPIFAPEALLVSADGVVQVMHKLRNMQNSEALELSIDRLLKSRVDSNLEDTLIDLGMAAEIALMHSPSGSGDGKAEITNKISTRAAWLLGANSKERLEISKMIRLLYTSRSVVVHTGRAKATIVKEIDGLDELVTRMLRAILDRGSFPDWTALVLGG